MARLPEPNQAFLREVNDEVRREQMTRVARRYGVIVAIVVAAALVITAVVLFWQHEREVRAGERGEQFTAALSSLTTGNAGDARRKLQPLAASGTPGYAPLARVLLADMDARDGRDAQAGLAFLGIANDASVAQPLRDLALVRSTAIGFDTLQPAAVIRRMAPLAAAGGAWAGSAGELIAIAQMKLGQNKAAAQTLLGVIKDKQAPESVRQRAAQLAGDLGVDVAAQAPGL